MTNAAANRQPTSVGKEGRKLNIGVDAGTHIYEGTLISQLTATGMAVPYSTASSGPVVGVSMHEADNSASGAADGDKEVQVEWDAEFVFANGTSTDEVLVSTPLGTVLFGTDDHTIALTDGGTGRQPVGFFCGLEPDGRVRVFVSPRAAAAVAADVGALTFTAVAGTANTTLEALPNPTDTPASADALRDDIVANLLPPLRNNFADLATQVNAIRTALRNAGLMG